MSKKAKSTVDEVVDEVEVVDEIEQQNPSARKVPERYFILFRASGVVVPDVVDHSAFDAIGLDYVRFSFSEMDDWILDNFNDTSLQIDYGRQVVLFTKGINTVNMNSSQIYNAYKEAMGSDFYDPFTTKLDLVYKFKKRKAKSAEVNKKNILFVSNNKMSDYTITMLNSIKEYLSNYDTNVSIDEKHFKALSDIKSNFDLVVYKIGTELGYLKKRGRKIGTELGYLKKRGRKIVDSHIQE